MVRTQTPINVLVVSTNAGLQDSLSRVLRRQADIDFLGSVRSPQEALDLLDGLPSTVMISNLVPVSATDVMSWRRLAEEGAQTLMLTSYMRDRDLKLFILAGAAGQLLAASGRGAALADAVRRISRGETVLDKSPLAELQTRAAAESTDSLNLQERRILALILERRTNLEIADDIGLSIEQVRGAVHGLIEKLS